MAVSHEHFQRGIYDCPPQHVVKHPLSGRLREFGLQIATGIQQDVRAARNAVIQVSHHINTVARRDILAVGESAYRTAALVDSKATQAVAVFDAIAAPFAMQYEDAPAVEVEAAITIHRDPSIKAYDPIQEYDAGVGALDHAADMDDVVKAGLAHLLGVSLATVEPQLAGERPELASAAIGDELSVRAVESAIPEVVAKSHLQTREIEFPPLPETPIGAADPAVDKQVVAFLEWNKAADSLPLGAAVGSEVLVKGRDEEGQRTDDQRIVFREPKAA